MLGLTSRSERATTFPPRDACERRRGVQTGYGNDVASSSTPRPRRSKNKHEGKVCTTGESVSCTRGDEQEPSSKTRDTLPQQARVGTSGPLSPNVLRRDDVQNRGQGWKGQQREKLSGRQTGIAHEGRRCATDTRSDGNGTHAPASAGLVA